MNLPKDVIEEYVTDVLVVAIKYDDLPTAFYNWKFAGCPTDDPEKIALLHDCVDSRGFAELAFKLEDLIQLLVPVFVNERHPSYDVEKQIALDYKNAGNSWAQVAEAADAGTIKFRQDAIRTYAKISGQTIIAKPPGRPSGI